MKFKYLIVDLEVGLCYGTNSKEDMEASEYPESNSSLCIDVEAGTYTQGEPTDILDIEELDLEGSDPDEEEEE